ncbi:hypothetical protein [Streptomyces sp. 7N604]|uniref:hypothetical protein n=1 Tax=Streptomyces sp. 7N604 TaxID=3457415 RepID=UPI003FD2B5D8
MARGHQRRTARRRPQCAPPRRRSPHPGGRRHRQQLHHARPRTPDLVDGAGGLGRRLLQSLTTSLYATPEEHGKTTHATLALA